MNTNNESIESPVITSVEEVIALLIKHHNIHDGFYILNLSLEVAAGQLPLPTNKDIGKPSVQFAIDGFGLQLVSEKVSNSVNAALVNPKIQENTE